MSQYTTGEMARLCNVTVRTVQYYDSCNLLVPSELSEGGRRLYSEEDLQLLKTICFLRDAGLSINNISELLKEENPGKVISVLVEEQSKQIKAEISEREEALERLAAISKEAKVTNDFSVKNVGDIAVKMKNRRKLYKERAILLIVGLIMDAIEIATLVHGITKKEWWPFIVSVLVVLAIGVAVYFRYMNKVAYICPECHKVFRSRGTENLFADHTPSLRKLTCTECGHKGFCVEVYWEPNGEKE